MAIFSEATLTKENIIKRFQLPSDSVKLLIGVFLASIALGVLTGYSLSNKSKGGLKSAGLNVGIPKSAQQDSRTFKDFAEGVIKVRPQPSDPSEYVEGTHFLERKGAVPVALTSSVVDLSQYENKKVKVFGETQKAIKEGWLMDVGKVEVVK